MIGDKFYVTLFTLSIVASTNALIFGSIVIITIVLNRQCHTVTNLLTCNTSGIVIIYAMFHSMVAVYGLREDWARNQPNCVFRGYVFLVLAHALCYSYTIQAISRLFFVVFSKRKYLLSRSTHIIMMIISGLVSIVFPIEPLFFNGAYIYEHQSRICLLTSQKFSTALYSIFTTFIIPYLIIGIAYIKILYEVIESGKRVGPTFTNYVKDKTPRINQKREIKLAKNMAVTLGCFTFGGIPYFILIIYQAIIPFPPPDSFFLLSVIFMSVFSSIMMMSVFYFNTEVRKIVLKYVCRH